MEKETAIKESKKEQSVPASNHIQKIKPRAVSATAVLDPGCRPTGT